MKTGISELMKIGLVLVLLHASTMTAHAEPSSATSFQVAAIEYGEDWPFWVSVAEIECRKDSPIVLIRLGDAVYGLNGKAKGQGYTDPFADHPRPRDPMTGAYLNGVRTISDLIRRGRSHCLQLQ